MSKHDTRRHILAVGEALVLEKGFHHTGLNEVLDRAGVPKGSFYYYFASKEAFGLALIDEFETANRAFIQACLGQPDVPPLERLRRYFALAADFQAARGYRFGCLLGNLGQELADQSEPFRVRLEAAFNAWAQDIAACLRAAQAAGQLAPTADPDALARFVLNSWQGAMLRMKLDKRAAPLEDFMTTTFTTVLRP